MFLEQFPTAIIWLDDGLGISERIQHEADVIKSLVHPKATQKIGKMAGRQLVEQVTKLESRSRPCTYLIDWRLAI